MTDSSSYYSLMEAAVATYCASLNDNDRRLANLPRAKLAPVDTLRKPTAKQIKASIFASI